MAAPIVLTSFQLMNLPVGGHGPSPYVQNAIIAFIPRAIVCGAVLIALLDLIMLGSYYLDPGPFSPTTPHDYLEVAKVCGIVAAGATVIGLIRDIYAVARTWFATHNNQVTKNIAKQEIAMTLGSALGIGFLCIAPYGFSPRR